MSEEEIIKNVKRIIEYKVISNYINNNDSRAIQGLLDLYNKEKRMYKNTGKIVKNKRDGKVGVVLREFETGQIQVLEKIGDEGGKVINTHDSWKTLEVIENE